MFFCCSGAFAFELDSLATKQDTISVVQDTIATTKKHNSFVAKAIDLVGKLFDVDTAYIEPQHYNFQAMMQNRYSYEIYRISDKDGNSVTFNPKPSMKIGPYAGWSLIFLGWSIDVLHLNDGNSRKELDISLYSLPVGIDFFWRQSGDDYSIKNIQLTDGIDPTPMERKAFDGFKSSVTGANIYYILNHKKFSYPAAFNQSTQQKISCGSPLAGIGYTRHSLTIDWTKLNAMAVEYLGKEMAELFTSDMSKENITYTDFSLSGGYGYNWVFAKNWLFASSLSLAISYKKASSNTERLPLWDDLSNIRFKDFKLSNITIDGVGRFGIVWNNNHWFGGASAIFHSYNYSKAEFYTNNIFGMINIYGGVNFGVKKKYRKRK